MSRVVAIGDIHGHARALDALLDVAAVTDYDLVVFLGDYVDRGPDSAGVLERVVARVRRAPTVALFGNHEEMMVEAPEDPVMRRLWLNVGGRETLASYASRPDGERLFDEHLAFLRQETVITYETETEVFVHGAVPSDVPVDEVPAQVAVWQKFNNFEPHCSGKRVVTGHTAQRSGVPFDLGHSICIDTFCYGGGWLTLLDCSGDVVYQANASGEQRRVALAELSRWDGPSAR